jgi:hypothetical protein
LFDKFKTKPPVSIAGQNIDPEEHPDLYNNAMAAGKKPGLLSRAGGAIKQGIDSLAQKAQTAGHNLTTKVTADKLQSAWEAAGSPTDSAAVEKFLQAQGVNPEVVNGAIQQATTADPTQEHTPTDEPTRSTNTPAADDTTQQHKLQPPAQLVNKPAFDINKLTPVQKTALLKQLDAYVEPKVAQPSDAPKTSNIPMDKSGILGPGGNPIQYDEKGNPVIAQ